MNAMVHAAGDELGNKFADFSADWLKDGMNDGVTAKANKTNNRKRLTSVKSETPIANRNISSIVSRIRDEGAAFSNSDAKIDKQTKQKTSSESVKKTHSEIDKAFADMGDDDIVSLSSNSRKVARQSPSEQGKNFRETSQKAPLPSFSAVCDQPVEAGVNDDALANTEVVQKKYRKKPIFLIAIMSFMMIAVLAYMSYQFKLQSDEMKQTLLMYKQAMGEAEKNHEQSLPVTDVSVKNKVLPILKQEDPIVFVERKNLASESIKEVKPVAMKSTAQLTTITEDKKVESAVKAPAKVSAKQALSVKPLPIKKSPVKTYVAADKPVMFTINLASFSDRVKAYGQLKVFESFGVSPVVEQAVVGNKTIYRLCVEGFSSREEADGFISRLNKKHAINAWVRQS